MNRLVSAALLAALGATVHAHHSHPDFLANERVALEGTIEFLRYVNPHSEMQLDGWERFHEGTALPELGDAFQHILWRL